MEKVDERCNLAAQLCSLKLWQHRPLPLRLPTYNLLSEMIHQLSPSLFVYTQYNTTLVIQFWCCGVASCVCLNEIFSLLLFKSYRVHHIITVNLKWRCIKSREFNPFLSVLIFPMLTEFNQFRPLTIPAFLHKVTPTDSLKHYCYCGDYELWS